MCVCVCVCVCMYVCVSAKFYYWQMGVDGPAIVVVCSSQTKIVRMEPFAQQETG